MPVGLVAFEIGAHTLVSIKRLRTRICAEVNAVGKSLQKSLSRILTKARPNNVTLLLLSIALYLVLSRCGPVLTRVGESTFEAFDLKRRLLRDLDPIGLQSLKGVYKIFRGVTRVPGPLARKSFYFIMGNKGSKSSTQKPKADQDKEAKVKQVEDVHSEPPPSEKVSSEEGSIDNPIKFTKLKQHIRTGDLAILKRAEQDIRHFAIFIHHSDCDPSFPLLLVKGKTKPMLEFDPRTKRHAHTVTAATRIFYGDYEVVAIRNLIPKATKNCHETIKIVDKIPDIAFSETEIKAIEEAKSPAERSSIVCTYMVAHFYKEMGVLETDPDAITPENLEANLSLSKPQYVKLPPVKEGPLAHGEPPFLSKLVDGILSPPDVETVPLATLVPQLRTGDLVLFSGATSSGAIIKFFDNSLFSHVGIVIRTQYSSSLMVWEASTNKAGLVDVQSGKVRKGVELLPLQSKIFSGWYDRVAIRRLTGIDDDAREKMYKDLLDFQEEVQGRPYEKNKMELILSAIDMQEEYLSFLRNTKEDLSSIFCSELVAEAYKRMGLLRTEKLSNEFTPDDFASSSLNELELDGRLEKEVYVELKFDFN